ncbi:hypothetical protein ACU64V_18930 [Lysinibacillus capsici]
MVAKNSEWISFLRQYGPIPRNDNMYDETIQRIIKKKKVTPIKIDMVYLDELVENFKLPVPVSVILTGTAGDGKHTIAVRFGNNLVDPKHFGMKTTKLMS